MTGAFMRHSSSRRAPFSVPANRRNSTSAATPSKPSSHHQLSNRWLVPISTRVGSGSSMLKLPKMSVNRGSMKNMKKAMMTRPTTLTMAG